MEGHFAGFDGTSGTGLVYPNDFVVAIRAGLAMSEFWPRRVSDFGSLHSSLGPGTCQLIGFVGQLAQYVVPAIPPPLQAATGTRQIC